MTVQILKLGRERFVLLREKDYRDLKAKARPARSTTLAKRSIVEAKSSAAKGRRLTVQDRGDIAEAKRREKEPSRPYQELRKELGLA